MTNTALLRELPVLTNPFSGDSRMKFRLYISLRLMFSNAQALLCARFGGDVLFFIIDFTLRHMFMHNIFIDASVMPVSGR